MTDGGGPIIKGEPLHFLGINWVGVNVENGQKLLLSLGFVAIVLLANRLLRFLVGIAARRSDHSSTQFRFWTRQGVSLLAAVVLILGLLSIWFNDPARLSTAFGLVSAGLAFALQQVVTSVAGYFVVLRGKTFTVGDRIAMGGVRGDVIRLVFIQTTIMEMGQPGGAESEAGMWVHSRQFTGRIVTVSNAKIFDAPVYNYTRDFPYIWEEIVIPITYQADREVAEQIILEATRRHAIDPGSVAADAKAELQERFGVEPLKLAPRVYYRITDNWLELTVRFVIGTHRIRDAKDAISRDMLKGLDAAGIGIASSTYDIVSLPPIEVRRGKAP